MCCTMALIAKSKYNEDDTININNIKLDLAGYSHSKNYNLKLGSE